MIALRQLPKFQIPIDKMSFGQMRPVIERYLLITTVLVVASVLVFSFARTLSSLYSPKPGIVHVKVKRGESLWTYAKKYGDERTYILKRVYRIAKLNGIDASRPLEPGQELAVPVERRVRCAAMVKGQGDSGLRF
ncbi:MAG: LysM peptidoglycan-binding domain-containing protein [Armatimonadetes bacterium]|nr:LysM peptidoglycan-binding domain-containing protein [Armatimonadota bacterium]